MVFYVTHHRNAPSVKPKLEVTLKYDGQSQKIQFNELNDLIEHCREHFLLGYKMKAYDIRGKLIADYSLPDCKFPFQLICDC
jgi:hypothetical protein